MSGYDELIAEFSWTRLCEQQMIQPLAVNGTYC